MAEPRTTRANAIRLLAVALVAGALSACHSPCSKVSCARSGVLIDLRQIPDARAQNATVTVCVNRHCRNAPAVEGRVGLPFETLGTRNATASSVSSIEVRVRLADRETFSASTTEHFPAWIETSRCPNCTQGNIFLVVDRAGTFRARSPF